MYGMNGMRKSGPRIIQRSNKAIVKRTIFVFEPVFYLFDKIMSVFKFEFFVIRYCLAPILKRQQASSANGSMCVSDYFKRQYIQKVISQCSQ